MFLPTSELPQFSLCQHPTSAFILELRLKLVYFHEEADGVSSDAWSCKTVFIKVNDVMLPNEGGGTEPEQFSLHHPHVDLLNPGVSHLVVGRRWGAGLFCHPESLLHWSWMEVLHVWIPPDLYHLHVMFCWTRCPTVSFWWHQKGKWETWKKNKKITRTHFKVSFSAQLGGGYSQTYFQTIFFCLIVTIIKYYFM